MTFSRRHFIAKSSTLIGGGFVLTGCEKAGDSASIKESSGPVVMSPTSANANTGYGVQLYTFREEMVKDPRGTLAQIAEIGIKQIETARSAAGHYYGLSASEMKNACEELGMTLRSGHVHIDEDWQSTIEQAVESGQEYLICSSMPRSGQTIDNYKRTAELFNQAGEQCKAENIKFGYHNHEYEFESDGDSVLYDVLMDNTQADLVHMELDLGWVIVGGKDPLDYFKKYPGRFPLWHLKDMDLTKGESTEFGKGALDIAKMLEYKDTSGVEYIFIEQEEYASTPLESMQHNMAFLKAL